MNEKTVTPNGRVTGTVKWYNEDKGYGFLKLPNRQRDVFVHCRQLRNSGIDDVLKEGENISFCIETGEKGEFATKIQRA